MLGHVMRLPSAALRVTRHTTLLSTLVLGEATSKLFPSLALPVDRIAIEAWALGLHGGDPSVPQASAVSHARTW